MVVVVVVPGDAGRGTGARARAWAGTRAYEGTSNKRKDEGNDEGLGH